MEPELERRSNDIAIAELTARLDGLENVFSIQLSNLTASINALRVSIEKLDAKGETSCGKCKAEIEKEEEDQWREIKKLRDTVETLKYKDGERAKAGLVWAVRIVGGLILVGIAGLVWAALKGA